MKHDVTTGFAGSLNLKSPSGANHHPLIPNLATSFRVKRSGLKDQLDLLALNSFLNQPLPFQNGLDKAFPFKRLVPNKPCRPDFLGNS